MKTDILKDVLKYIKYYKTNSEVFYIQISESLGNISQIFFLKEHKVWNPSHSSAQAVREVTQVFIL